MPLISDARFASLMETRILLETAAARRALPNISAAGSPISAGSTVRCGISSIAADIDGTIEANMAFHRRLYSFAPDDVLTPLIESVWLQVGPYMRAALHGSREHYRTDRHTEALRRHRGRRRGRPGARPSAPMCAEGIGHLIAGRPLKASVAAATWAGQAKRGKSVIPSSL